jgi:DeoR/GlpR family transcriptional regulator of sugar metabolism
MLSAERQNRIIEQLNLTGKVLATELAEQLAVSEDTIRRDLNKMGEAGLIRRVHGGALPLQQTNPDYIDRLNNPDTGKKRFAQAAVELIKPGQTILIDSGEICLYLARLLPKDLPLTVITGCPMVACELSRHQKIEVILLGGRFFKPALRCVGTGTTDMLRKMRFDMCFFGIYALHLKHGMSVNYIEEAEISQVAMEQADKCIIMGAADKLDKTSSHQIVPIEKINILITEKNGDQHLLNKLSDKGLEIITV